MKLQVGEKAPEFELRSDTMERVELSALRGSKLLLLFVPLALTFKSVLFWHQPQPNIVP